MAYCIDVDARNPKILNFSGDALDFDLKYYKAKKATDLTTYERRVFNDLDAATKFYNKYLETLKNLDNKKICKSRDLPTLRYKRHYIVLTLMGLKNETYRKKSKKWEVGQLINLQDQTYFLTVKIKSITKIKDEYCYKFSL